MKEESQMKIKRTMNCLLCLALCLLFLFSFAACKGNRNSAEEAAGSAAPTISDKSLSLSVPLSAIDEELRNDLDGFCKKYGYESATLGEDGKSVNVVVNEFNYKLKMTNRGMEAIKGIYAVAEDSKTYPYVAGIESYDDKDFREVVLLVSKKKYDSDPSKELAAFSIGQSCLLYQAYSTLTDYECKVIIKDKSTKEVIETKTYNEFVF